jgi:hypothetical protein
MKVVLSGIATDLRGTFGNAVASRNNNGVFLRQRVTPKSTVTDIRRSALSRFSIVANAWSNIGATVQSLYVAAAATYTFFDSLGVAYTPTGYQLFQYLNVNIYPVNSGFILSPPNYTALLTPNVAYSAFTSSPTVASVVSAASLSADEFIKIFSSAYYPGHTQRSNYPVNIIATISPSDTLPFDLSAYLDFAHNNPATVNNLVVMQAQRVNSLTGSVSPCYQVPILFS